MWEHFHHQADIGIRGVGATLEEAFGEAGLALTAVVCNLERIENKKNVEIHCQNDDTEMLFADWLNAVIYEMDTRRMLFGKYEVKIEGAKLYAKAWGEKIDDKKHEPAVEVKAATYMMLKVAKQNDGNWVVQCVVDV